MCWLRVDFLEKLRFIIRHQYSLDVAGEGQEARQAAGSTQLLLEDFVA